MEDVEDGGGACACQFGEGVGEVGRGGGRVECVRWKSWDRCSGCRGLSVGGAGAG